MDGDDLESLEEINRCGEGQLVTGGDGDNDCDDDDDDQDGDNLPSS